jgi:hypothetical protein
MAIGLGQGSEANVPLARAVVGGLLTSTFLTLFVVPILFTLLIRDRDPEPDIETELAEVPADGARVRVAPRTVPIHIEGPRRPAATAIRGQGK